MIRFLVIFFVLFGFAGGTAFAAENGEDDYVSNNYEDSTLGIKAQFPKDWVAIESLVHEDGIPMNVIMSFPPLAIFGGVENFNGIMLAHTDNESISSKSYFDSLESSGCHLSDNNIAILEFNEMKAMEFYLACTPKGFDNVKVDALGYSFITEKNTFFVVFLGSEKLHQDKFENFRNSVHIEDTVDLSDEFMINSIYDIQIKNENQKINDNVNMPVILYKDSDIQNFNFDADNSSISFIPVVNNNEEDYFQADFRVNGILDPKYLVDITGDDDAEYFIISDKTIEQTTISIHAVAAAESFTDEIIIKGQLNENISNNIAINSNSLHVIPDWIKTNAEWWTKDQIDDTTFISGLQYLINQNIISVSVSHSNSPEEKSEEIPSWIKNNAEWWSQGLISDEDFKKGIQYLIQQRIIILV